ncbi:rRNA processing/ribosome biogenesis-domain-containing protein [Geopyxis carbonaria]|nr:rRNA processing/ribosome biogenesis-domain-containing protein [Geopyxis carbonaria]
MPSADPLQALRSLTRTLTSTPESDLPAQIPSIAAALYSQPILEAGIALSSQRQRASEEAAVLLNKFKTRVSALLQSKAAPARWCGVVLAKCAVESSFEALATYGAVWTRLMVPLVARPEPPTTHIMVLRTLTRIFTHLTADRPTLTREIVTPHLPVVFTGLLNLVKTSTEDVDGALLATALEALRDLITAHPVTFRPFSQKVRAGLLMARVDQNVERLCREIYVSLHLCASNSSKRGQAPTASSEGSGKKVNAVAKEWAASISAVIDSAHNALDVVFAPVTEDYDYRNASSRSTSPDADLPEGQPDLLLRLLKSFFILPTPAQPTIPLPKLLDLTSRIFAVTAASQPNSAVETHLREALFFRLPSLHAAALDLLDTVCRRLQSLFLPFVPTLLEQVSFIVDEERWSADVRIAAYTLTTTLLTLAGAGLPGSSADSVHTLLTACSNELLPPPPPRSAPSKTLQKASTKSATAGTSHADFLLSNTKSALFSPPGATAAASALLTAALQQLPPSYLRSDTRVKLERAAILSANRTAVYAAVMAPRPGAKVSLLPHLVGLGVDMHTEALLRPRLPVVWTGPRKATGDDEDEPEAEDDHEDEDGDEDGDESIPDASPPPQTSPAKRVNFPPAPQFQQPQSKRQRLSSSPSTTATGTNTASSTPSAGFLSAGTLFAPPAAAAAVSPEKWDAPAAEAGGVGVLSSPSKVPLKKLVDGAAEASPVKWRETGEDGDGSDGEGEEEGLVVPEIWVGSDSDSDSS